MKEQMLLNEVAKEIGVKAYQISYAISSGSLPEPSTERINNKRIFNRKEVGQIQKYFAGKQAKKEEHAK